MTFTEEGNEAIEDLLAKAGILPEGQSLYSPESTSIVHHVNQALRAHLLFHKDQQYIVRDGEVLLIDEFTGRMMKGRRLSDGLHQAIEAKEQVEIKPENVTYASVTFQNYFRLYEKLSGMTGTAKTEAEEFREIYGLGVVEVPTNRTVMRADEHDQVFRTGREKYEGIVKSIKEAHEKRQPILVGTTSIEKSEQLAALLTGAGITHNVLNARQHEQEAKIVADAGKLGAVTIATNMAGRGTDIKLGGNVEFKVMEAIAADPEGSVFSGGSGRPYLVEGVGEDFFPAAWDPDLLDDIIPISDEESFLTARYVSQREGILIGGSGGMAVAAALKVARTANPDDVVVVFNPDSGRGYLSRVFDDAWMANFGFLRECDQCVGAVLDTRNASIENLLYVNPQQLVSEAIELMRSNGVSQLPVCKNTPPFAAAEVSGSIDELELMEVIHRDPSVMSTPVEKVMGPKLPTIGVGQKVELAVAMLETAPALLVLSGGRPLSVLTRTDVLAYFTAVAEAALEGDSGTVADDG